MRSVTAHPTAPVRVVLNEPDGWSVRGEGMVPRAGVTRGRQEGWPGSPEGHSPLTFLVFPRGT